MASVLFAFREDDVSQTACETWDCVVVRVSGGGARTDPRRAPRQDAQAHRCEGSRDHAPCARAGIDPCWSSWPMRPTKGHVQYEPCGFRSSAPPVQDGDEYHAQSCDFVKNRCARCSLLRFDIYTARATRFTRLGREGLDHGRADHFSVSPQERWVRAKKWSAEKICGPGNARRRDGSALVCTPIGKNATSGSDQVRRGRTALRLYRCGRTSYQSTCRDHRPQAPHCVSSHRRRHLGHTPPVSKVRHRVPHVQVHRSDRDGCHAHRGHRILGDPARCMSDPRGSRSWNSRSPLVGARKSAFRRT